ncbi:MAG: hypothetical protein KDG52_12065 [Rhodocyclaceae bacterium]|nr:hypothetical protein [Rhodocyclaceae bacterium]
MSIQKRLLVCALLPALGACTSTTDRLDARFGQSMTALQAQQTADPAAPLRNQDRMVLGFEARAAAVAVDRYYSSFAKPPKPVNIFNIGFGSRQSGQ